MARERDALVLTGLKGVALRPHVLQNAWNSARLETDLVHLHLHDMRHAGLTWSAATGATLAELMHRAGHKSPAAALRYQHATKDRDRALAQALSELAPKAKVVDIVGVARDSRGMESKGRARRRTK